MKKPGKRIYKTVVAVGLCLLIGELFDTLSPFYMCISTILSLKTTPEHSFKYGRDREIGTILGALFGLIILLMIDWLNIETTSWLLILINMAGIFACLWVAKNLALGDVAASMSCVVLFTITIVRVNEPVVPLPYVITRTIETFIGIMVAVLVNKYLFIDKRKLKS